MEKALSLLQQEFESSSTRTPQYLAYHKLFKREFTKLLVKIGCSEIRVSKPNHFDITGFFLYEGQWWYFSLGDLRWGKDQMLIRTATHSRDFTGGLNQYIPMDLQEFDWVIKFINIVAR